MLNIPSEQHELPDHYGPPLSDKYGPPPPVMMMSKPLVSLSLAGGGATRFDRSANLTAATDNKEDYDNDNTDVVEDVENEFGEQVKHLDHLIYNTSH